MGVWAPNFGGAAPGFEPRTSCLRVRSVTITLRGPLIWLIMVLIPVVLALHKGVKMVVIPTTPECLAGYKRFAKGRTKRDRIQ